MQPQDLGILAVEGKQSISKSCTLLTLYYRRAGGRIAVYYKSSTFAGTVQATGGASTGHYYGGPGI